LLAELSHGTTPQDDACPKVGGGGQKRQSSSFFLFFLNYSYFLRRISAMKS
jgi:hypothetical protein